MRRQVDGEIFRIVVLVAAHCYIVRRNLRRFQFQHNVDRKVVTDWIVNDTTLTNRRGISRTKMTSNNDSVVAVILVGSFINCCRFISRVKLLMAAYSRQELSRPSQFRSARIIIGLFNKGLGCKPVSLCLQRN